MFVWRSRRPRAGVVAANPDLDRVYLERWGRELDVLDLWRRVSGGPALNGPVSPIHEA